ncbi:MAG: hypothetical protein KJO07_23430 [Deltaproteobacteria bacterium]|nr:hypothetical protein [Deltaproteobacteria bacterium]
MTTDPKQLLAAYASGDVTDDERRLVEDHLADVGTEDELAATRAVLGEVRAAEPIPAKLPDFEALAASTMREIASQQSVQAPGPKPWMRAGAWSAGLAMAALAVFFLFIRGTGEQGEQVAGSADAGAPALVNSQNPDADELTAELPNAEWLLPSSEPQLASAEGLDVLADDWLIGDDQQENVILDDLDLDELKAIDEALASL